ncbi:MAG: flavodoxin family protein [Methanomassiliicoccales archaeon]|nr:MAG: flavodoxin family protein [Methanomassiliicoccales archaeon]
MKVIGISGSPRAGGNTELLVAEALEGARSKGAEVEIVTLAGKDIKGCVAHPTCGQGGKCLIEDDMQPIYAKLMEADAIIIGTPIYFGSMTSQTKAFLDRTYLLSKMGKKLEGKVGGVIAVGGRAGHELTTSVILDFMTLQGMVLPPYAFAHSYVRDLGAAKGDEKSMKAARALGERVASLASKTR